MAPSRENTKIAMMIISSLRSCYVERTARGRCRPAGVLLMNLGGDFRTMDFTAHGQPRDLVDVNGAGRQTEEHARAVEQAHRPAGDRRRHAPVDLHLLPAAPEE